ncbi:kinesin-like protein KIF20B isoform X1 [Argiope bruennichi]|uniref:kinesin-like protein KIF20B isoform X1 n=1 Tax=Argiope bruennichi TaxID=94029 RepID=UPI002495791A|nr:kinesin-like protein KIF20B isoform X1 [Argiope bruennichi]XP_055939753.1 kinesin-like protein KIF20B isoform X1 [Argiope bruennichi]
MSFSPLDNREGESPINLPRVTMCLDGAFQDELKEEDLPKSENMKVFARVRPMLQKEEDAGYRDCIAAIDDETVRAVVPANSVKFKNSGLNPQDVFDFKYTQAFGPDIGQFVFFEQTIMDTMVGLIEGQNCLIFNYGITNSGKTYTLQGNEANPGIIPLAMHLFFGCIESQLMNDICVKPDKFSDTVVLNDSERTQEYRLKEELLRLVDHDSINKTTGSETSISSSRSSKLFSQVLCECFRDDFKYQSDTTLPPDEMIAAQSALYMREQCKKKVDDQPGKCNIWVSFIEIYNEYIYDLLQPNITQRQKLSLAEDQNGDVYVKGAREICVSNSMEAIKLLQVGRRNLRIASTKLNYQSSRSHCIFTVKIARVYDDEEHGTCGRVNRISFCDLAGSERANKAQTSGMRLKEAGYINTSLMVLGRCLDQLRRNQTARDKKMIPFRESKLTRLFSNHFLGKGKAVMIANASPCEYTFDETLNVLRFSALAKDLTIADSYISTAQSSILDICNQWRTSKNRNSGVSPDQSCEFDSSFMQELEEKDEMIEKLVDVAESLRLNLEKERKEKIELEFKIRQEVGNEYAAYSDGLLDEQKEIFERQIESLREIYTKRIEAMKEMYEKKIRELQEEDGSEDSFEKSISEINKTFDKLEEESLISFSPAVGALPKQEVPKAEGNVSVTVDTSMDFFDAVAEEEDEKSTTDIQSLKKELESVSKELDVTKIKLEQTTKNLKESQSEGAIAKEKSDALNCKLLEANQVLEEYQKELEQLKANCVSFENEIDSLLEERKKLQDNILHLSGQIAQSTTETEQLKKEKCEMEESYSLKLAESEQKIADLEDKCRELSCKLEESVQTIEEEKMKFNKLEEEYVSYKSNVTSTAEEFSDLKEKFNSFSQQLAQTENEAEQLKKEKLEMEEDYSQKLSESEKKIADLEEKCRELNCKLEDVEMKYNNLKEEYDIYKSDTTSTSEEFSDLKEQFTAVSQQLAQTQNEIEQFKKEKLEMEEDYAEKLAESEKKIADLEEKCSELNCKLEDVEMKYNILKEEYDIYKSDTTSTSEEFSDLKEKYTAISQQLAQTEKEAEQLKKEKLEMEEGYCRKLAESEKKIADLEETSSEANCKLEESVQILKDLKMKYNNLEEEYDINKSNSSSSAKDFDDLKAKFAEMSEELELATSEIELLKNEKLSAETDFSTEKMKLIEEMTILEEKCKELNLKSENLTKITAEEKSKYDELEAEYINYKKNICSETEDKENVTEQLSMISKELDVSNLQIENLRKEKLELEENFAKEKETLNEELKSVNEKSKELGLELEKITEILKGKQSEVSELMSKCDHLETENAKLLQNIRNYEENSVSEKTDDTHTAKIEELDSKLEEVNKLLEEKQSKIDQLEKECSYHKSENADLLKALDAEKEKYAKLFEEQASAITEVEHLQKEITEAVDVHSKALSNVKTEEAIAQEKCNELLTKLEETSKMIEDQKIKISEAEENSSKYKNLNLELSENLTSLKEDYSSFTEIYGKLVQVLQKCELSATNKIKQLHSSSIKNLDLLVDLSRQIREKETSIEELERALCDCQNQLKESEAKAKKQMHALKQQHSVEIEEMAHLKKLVEEENLQLKSTVAEMEKKDDKKEGDKMDEDVKKEQDEMDEDVKKEEDKKKEEKMKRSSSNVSRGRKKRSISDVSKEEVDCSQDKENSDRESRKEKVNEEKATSKRRRVLRSRQETADDNNSSHSESEEESHKTSIKKKEEIDDEYKPPAKTATRRKAPAKERSRQTQKKTTVEELKVPATRTSRRKLQDENQSPVQKAMAFVGSKLRSVVLHIAAQTVSNMPSPRITRGRRKLFNADAATPLERKWKL